MTPSYVIFSLFVLGCVFTQSSAAPAQTQNRVKRNPDGAADGTADAIKERPENTKSYTSWGNTNFAGVQNIMDGHFMKKKKEGDQITKYGEKSRKENEVMHDKVEKGQYNSMYESFKWAEGEMQDSEKSAARSSAEDKKLEDAEGQKGDEEDDD